MEATQTGKWKPLMNGNSNGYPHIFDHVRLGYGNADTALHRSTYGTQYQFRFSGRHFEFPMSVDVDSVIFKSGVVKNVVVAVGMALPSLSVHVLSG